MNFIKYLSYSINKVVNDFQYNFDNTSLIPMGFSEEEALNLIDGNIGMSLHLVNQYLDVLMKLMHGEITFEDYLDELPEAFTM